MTGTEPPEEFAVRLSRAQRAALALRILGDAAAVWIGLRRRTLSALASQLGRPGEATRPVEPRRLGRIVYRAMNLGPFRPRCLTMSLVLFRELWRQGTAAELVIGLPGEPRDHRAHAWVEVEGRVVGPPPGRLGHVELARYGGSGSGGIDARSRSGP